MATVKSVKSAIKSSEYVVKSIKYILSPETKSGDEKCVQSSFLNCCNNSIDSLVTQFDVTRFALIPMVIPGFTKERPSISLRTPPSAFDTFS